MASITDQNWIIWNQGKNPLVNFNFMLRVELMFDLPCKSVRAFTRELEYDYIQEGGLNDYVHMRRKPITRPFTLEIERYVGVDYIDPLPLGADLVLPVLLLLLLVVSLGSLVVPVAPLTRMMAPVVKEEPAALVNLHSTAQPFMDLGMLLSVSRSVSAPLTSRPLK